LQANLDGDAHHRVIIDHEHTRQNQRPSQPKELDKPKTSFRKCQLSPAPAFASRSRFSIENSRR
jgi:hypothetical protein